MARPQLQHTLNPRLMWQASSEVNGLQQSSKREFYLDPKQISVKRSERPGDWLRIDHGQSPLSNLL
jgi:hypothetical protein